LVSSNKVLGLLEGPFPWVSVCAALARWRRIGETFSLRVLPAPPSRSSTGRHIPSVCLQFRQNIGFFLSSNMVNEGEILYLCQQHRLHHVPSPVQLRSPTGDFESPQLRRFEVVCPMKDKKHLAPGIVFNIVTRQIQVPVFG